MILYPGHEFAPPLAAFPIFKLDASSSVIYNLYEGDARGVSILMTNHGVAIEIINSTRGGIDGEIWERGNGGQIEIPD